MAEILVMPKLGLTMEEGFLESWLCEPGTAVALGEPICEVETDKLTVVVESPYAGVLLRCIEPGGHRSGWRADRRHRRARRRRCRLPPVPARQWRSGPAAARAASAAQPTPSPSQRIGKPPQRPASRSRQESRQPRRWPGGSPPTLDINLATVTGTGPEGRITQGGRRARLPHVASARGAAGPLRRRDRDDRCGPDSSADPCSP